MGRHKAYFIAIGLLFCLSFKSVFAQSDSLKSVNAISLGIHHGFIIPHAKELRGVSTTRPWGAELTYSWHLLKQDTWEYCFCYPRTGLSLLYMNFMNRDVLGSAIAIYPYIEPYFAAQRDLNFSFRFAIGPALMTKVYDSIANPENLFVSSPLSFIVLLRLSANYRINELYSIRLHTTFNHISNGGISNPNKGINFPTASLHLDRYFSIPNFEIREKEKSKNLDSDKHKLFIEYMASGKSAQKGKERHLVTGLSASYGYVFGRISGLRLGLEAVSDNATLEKIQKRNILEDDGDFIDHKYLGLLAGHDFLLGRFIFYQHIGFYLYNPYQANHPKLDRYYQRYGFNFYLTKKKNILLGINLKAHRHVADYLDFRIGVKL